MPNLLVPSGLKGKSGYDYPQEAAEPSQAPTRTIRQSPLFGWIALLVIVGDSVAAFVLFDDDNAKQDLLANNTSERARTPYLTATSTPTPDKATLRGAWLGDMSLLEVAVQDEVNLYRRIRGLYGLEYNLVVADIARRHSRYSASVGAASHTGAGGTDVDDRFRNTSYACGENVLMMPRATMTRTLNGIPVSRENDIRSMNTMQLARYLVQAWIESPGHEENMRGRYYELGGVGAWYDTGTEELYVTHDLCFKR